MLYLSVEQAEKLCADAIDAGSHGICGCPWSVNFLGAPWASISEAADTIFLSKTVWSKILSTISAFRSLHLD